MKRNPRDWRVADLKVVAEHHGVQWRQHGTSHVIFGHPAAVRVVSVPAARPVKPAYVRQFVALLQEVMREPVE